MKRIWLILLALLSLGALTVGSAFALEVRTPVNEELHLHLPVGDVVPKSGFSVTTSGSLTTGSDVTFTVSGGTVSSFEISMKSDWFEGYDSSAVYYTKGKPKESYHFMEPGTYYIWVNGNYAEQIKITGKNLLDTRVKNIMSKCKATTDYEIALWAHDWLTLHTYYDSTYSYYGADYLLNADYGWGVCQSYATAYYKMLKSKGIDVEFISSERINHAWNAVCIDGSWYEADVTWDTVGYDEYGKGTPATYNYHFYFMVPDLLFQTLGHVGQPKKYETKCVSMASNYYVKSGYAEKWLNENVEEQLNLQLTGSKETVTVQISGQSENITSGWDFDVPDQLCAAAIAEVLNGAKRIGANGKAYLLSASCDGTALTVTATQTGFDYSGMKVLILPEKLTAIESQALVNNGAQVIIIPSGVTSVASDAFDNCRKLKYIINRSSLDITAPSGVKVIVE